MTSGPFRGPLFITTSKRRGGLKGGRKQDLELSSESKRSVGAGNSPSSSPIRGPFFFEKTGESARSALRGLSKASEGGGGLRGQSHRGEPCKKTPEKKRRLWFKLYGRKKPE